MLLDVPSDVLPRIGHVPAPGPGPAIVSFIPGRHSGEYRPRLRKLQLMEESPRVVPVTDIRRDVARLIEEVNRSCRPVFISQRGYLTAVLMSCDRYEALRRELNTSQRTQRGVRLGRDEPVSRMEFGPYDIETAQLFSLEGYATELDELSDDWLPGE